MYTHSVISKREEKGKYGLLSNLSFVLKCTKEWNRGLFLLIFVSFVPGNLASLFSTLLPAQLVDHLVRGSSPAILAGSTAFVALAVFLCNLASECIYSDFDAKSYVFSGFFASKYADKILHMDFAVLDTEDFKKWSDSAWRMSRHGSGASAVLFYLPYFTSNFAATAIYGLILARRSILLTLIIICSVVLDMCLLMLARRQHENLLEDISRDSRKAEYITSSVNTAEAGKDIRIYHMLDWILKKYDTLLEDMDRSYRRIHNWYLLRNSSAAVFDLIKNGVAYLILLTMLTTGKIGASEFVFYIGAISNFAMFLENMLRNVQVFHKVSPEIGKMRMFLEAEENTIFTGELSEQEAAKIRRGAVTLEFCDVSFAYASGERQILSHVSFTVKEGERLALLGLNGAGKTTIVKLVCGFYKPDSGEIRLNGIPIYKFDRGQYLECISVLFQDATFLPLTVDQNITDVHSEQEIDRQRLYRALSLSGFLDKYERLSQGGKTELGKELNAAGIDLSGGEKQKLIFARALYKEAPLLILDEPTAALDPIAEHELYVHYGEAMQGKTGIFISHRLSSTRFCDRILLLEDGAIIEEGTHESLLAQGGRYASLYEMQSQYYKEQEENA